MFDHNSVSRPTRAIEVVYCYFESDKDEELRDELEKHLTTLKREGLITSWCKKEIQAGGEEESQINKHIDTASLILLLISSDFIASPTCYDQQFDRAIKRYENAEAHVMPVLLRPVDWHDSRFGDMRPLPTNGVPVTSWSNSDEAFQDITKEIRNVVKEFWLRDEQRINESYNQLRKELATQEWRKAVDDSWLEYENLQFNLNSPEGHLPYSGVHFWQAVPSFPSEPPNINYYKLPHTRDEFYYRYPVNYYQRQKTFQEQFKPRNQLDSYLSNSEFKREIEQISIQTFSIGAKIINLCL
jgi:hypothetical protein